MTGHASFRPLTTQSLAPEAPTAALRSANRPPTPTTRSEPRGAGSERPLARLPQPPLPPAPLLNDWDEV